MTMKYSVITFGCRVNQADSLGFEEELLARGAVASAPDAADLVIVNTCSVTATSDQGARQTIRRGDGDGACGAAIEPGVMGRTAFTLRVQTGCAEPCSYCIIPATRGAPRSVPIDDVMREVDRVIASGFREVVL